MPLSIDSIVREILEISCETLVAMTFRIAEYFCEFSEASFAVSCIVSVNLEVLSATSISTLNVSETSDDVFDNRALYTFISIFHRHIK